jgi:acetyl esterase/lipase
LSYKLEGTSIAEWFNAHGVAAFVLRYRTAPYHYPAELVDGQRAVRLVRSRAAEFGVAPDHIGVIGFSAGGHLVSTLMTHFNAPLPNTDDLPHDTLDNVSARPDFGVLSYAVISMMPGTTHAGTHENLLGKTADPKMETEFSNNLQVQPDSPPAFIWATTDDGTVPVMNSVLMYEAYVAKKLPVEMHLYEHGKHGLGLAEGAPGAEAWPDALAAWMRVHGWMAPAVK